MKGTQMNAYRDIEIREVDSMISHLERTARHWGEQIGIPNSAMKPSDVNFINRQIRRLEKAKQAMAMVMDAVDSSVKQHTQNW